MRRSSWRCMKTGSAQKSQPEKTPTARPSRLHRARVGRPTQSAARTPQFHAATWLESRERGHGNVCAECLGRNPASAVTGSLSLAGIRVDLSGLPRGAIRSRRKHDKKRAAHAAPFLSLPFFQTDALSLCVEFRSALPGCANRAWRESTRRRRYGYPHAHERSLPTPRDYG